MIRAGVAALVTALSLSLASPATPAPVPQSTTVLLWNVANSDARHGSKTVAARRPGIFRQIEKRDRDIVGLVEVGPVAVRKPWIKAFVKRGRYRIANTRWSQAIAIRKGRGYSVGATSQVPLTAVYQGKRRYLLSAVVKRRGVRQLVITHHLEYRKTKTALRVRDSQFRQVLAYANSRARQLKIPLGHVIIMGDENGGLNAQAGPWVDVVQKAPRTKHAGRKSTRSWNAHSTAGHRVDKIRIHRSAKNRLHSARNRANVRAGHADHNQQTAALR